MNLNHTVLIPYRSREKAKPYAEAVRAAGLEPLPIEVTASASLQGCAGLLLAGGTDVNPQRYGQPPRAETDLPDDERDEFELAVLRQAQDRGLPVLAICRGMQILNVFYGGTLIQHLDLPLHDAQPERKSDPAHQIEIEPATRLGSIAGGARWHVNSRHHQAVDDLGAGLQISARAPGDGIVEGLEGKEDRFVVAVQWHPEDQINDFPEQLGLFSGFANAIRAHSQRFNTSGKVANRSAKQTLTVPKLV